MAHTEPTRPLTTHFPGSDEPLGIAALCGATMHTTSTGSMRTSSMAYDCAVCIDLLRED